MAVDFTGNIFTEAEYQALILARCSGDGATKDDLAKWVEWCETVRVDNATVNAVLTGKVEVTWLNDEWNFRRKADADA